MTISIQDRRFPMIEQRDWRLQGQERYLMDAVLRRRAYRRYPKDPSWDHDHCEFW